METDAVYKGKTRTSEGRVNALTTSPVAHGVSTSSRDSDHEGSGMAAQLRTVYKIL
jgi:hypothetical protein